MATQAGFDTNAFGPFGAVFESYLSAIEALGQGKVPGAQGFTPGLDIQDVAQQMTGPLKATARCQLELLGLANRRAQAYMQVPTKLAQCRSPQDLINEQMAFWRTATEQYRESAMRIGQAWGAALPWGGNFGAGRSAERDYITFNGSRKEAGAQERRPDPSGSQRRVA
jgi:hypothetical protein